MPGSRHGTSVWCAPTVLLVVMVVVVVVVVAGSPQGGADKLTQWWLQAAHPRSARQASGARPVASPNDTLALYSPPPLPGQGPSDGSKHVAVTAAKSAAPPATVLRVNKTLVKEASAPRTWLNVTSSDKPLPPSQGSPRLPAGSKPTAGGPSAPAAPRQSPSRVEGVAEDVVGNKERPVSREEVEEPATRSPKLDVEWFVPSRRPPPRLPTFDPDAEAEVVKTPSTSTSTTTTTTTTSTTTTTTAAPTTTTSTTTTTAAPTTTTSTTTTAAPPTAPTLDSGQPGHASPSPGAIRPIVPKCCPPGQRVLSEKKKCVESPLEFIPPFVEYDEEFSEAAIDGSLQDDEDNYYFAPPDTVVTEAEGYDMIIGNPCKYGRFRLEPHVDSRDEFYLLSNGSLMAPFLFEWPLGTQDFCMDVFPDTDNGDVMVLPLVCFPPQDGPKRTGIQFILYPIGLLLSVPFLVTTFVLYAMTPALRDVHGKALMCEVTCQTVAYITLAFVQLWGSYLNQGFCFAIACIVQFSFFACFLWLNVMCINTWFNMALRPAQKWCRRTERRRFVLYSMYAWSLPCMLLGITLVMDLTPTIPSSYVKPRFGVDTCWFQTDRAALPYFYGPVTMLVAMNLALFVMTVVMVHRRRRHGTLNASITPLTCDTLYQRHSGTAFRNCLYLFGAMGLNWIMEVVSFYVGGPPYVWYATDILNCLQGVITFIIFVLNAPVRREIRARFVQLRARRLSGRVVDEPQIDDFQTVVQRQNRLSSRLSVRLTPWQEAQHKAEQEALRSPTGSAASPSP